MPNLDPFPMVVLGRLAEAAQLVARDRLAPLFARYGLQAGEFDIAVLLQPVEPVRHGPRRPCPS